MSLIDLERLRMLSEARKDLKYLLDRGYNRSSALKLIGDRRQLSRSERSILYRSVYSRADAEAIASKRVKAGELIDAEVWADGFNILNTVEAMLRGDPIILSDDGVLRDFSEIHGKYRLTQNTHNALNLIVEGLKELRVAQAWIIFESQISRSGEIAAYTRKLLDKAGLRGGSMAMKAVDSELIRSGEVVLSSDSAILLRCKKFFDISAYMIRKLSSVKIISLASKGEII